MWGQLSTTCSYLLKQPNGELLVAADHNQLRTMASETVDTIDWVHPTPSWAVPPELHVLHGVNAANKSQDLLQQPGLEHASTGMLQTDALPVRPLRVYTQGLHCSYRHSTYNVVKHIHIRINVIHRVHL